MTPIPPSNFLVTEADLHALVDGRLTPERQREVQEYLSRRPEEAERGPAAPRAASAAAPGRATGVT